jgi:hypothetical protein
MASWPLANGETGGFERLRDIIGEAGLQLDDALSGMETGPTHCIGGTQAFVENTGHDLNERAP